MAATNFNGNGNGGSHGRPPKGGDSSSLIDRLPPQNLEAEQGVLGSILLDNEVVHDVVSKLKVEDFYRDTHQTIYRAIRELYDLGKPIDGLTLSHALAQRGELQAVGGDEALSEMVESVPHAA